MDKYNQQAKNFLQKYNLTINIQEAVPQKSPIWVKDPKNENHGINYWITLKENKTGGKEYGFDFWGSIKDKENRFSGKPKPPVYIYDILACLDTSADGYTYEDFCFNYGYDEETRLAKKTYTAVQYQIKKLKDLLSPEAIDELNNIN